MTFQTSYDILNIGGYMSDYTKAYVQLKDILAIAGEINTSSIPEIDYGTFVDLEQHTAKFMVSITNRDISVELDNTKYGIGYYYDVQPCGVVDTSLPVIRIWSIEDSRIECTIRGIFGRVEAETTRDLCPSRIKDVLDTLQAGLHKFRDYCVEWEKAGGSTSRYKKISAGDELEALYT